MSQKTLMTRPCPYCGKQTRRSDDRCQHCSEPLPKDIQWWVYALGALLLLSVIYLLVDWPLWFKAFGGGFRE